MGEVGVARVGTRSRKLETQENRNVWETFETFCCRVGDVNLLFPLLQGWGEEKEKEEEEVAS